MPSSRAAVLTPAGKHRIEVVPLRDDGLIPNNASLPLILYRRVLQVDGGEADESVKALFGANGWVNAWVDGIYAYHHYHSTAHEVLGIAGGRARVMLGGPGGIAAELGAGDVVLIPAGVGHCLLDSARLSVVGAYPRGQDWDLCRATEADRAKALHNIPRVPLPEADPVFGDGGPVHRHWLR